MRQKIKVKMLLLLMDKSQRRGAITNFRDELCYVIKAWNAYYKNRPVKVLNLSDDLPRIAGLIYHPGDYFYQE